MQKVDSLSREGDEFYEKERGGEYSMSLLILLIMEINFYFNLKLIMIDQSDKPIKKRIVVVR